MIETYFHDGEGYNPFLIRDKWQVAQLNYAPGHGFDDVENLEVHHNTDEVFILFKGEAVLIEAELTGDDILFGYVKMEPGVTYNVPAGTWHNIAMSREVEIIIVEKSQTHQSDCSYLSLDEKQKINLYAGIRREIV